MKLALNKISSKWLGFLILFILFAFLNYNGGTFLRSQSKDLGSLLTDQVVLREFRGAVSYEEPQWEDELHKVLDDEGETIGFFLLSLDNRWNHSGYAGPVPLIVKLDASMRITGISLLENRETPRFLRKIYGEKFLKSWNNMTLAEASQSHVDTISGVTLTTRTIIANFSEYLESSQGISQMGRLDMRSLLLRIGEAFVLIAALISFFRKGFRRFRTIRLVLNTVILGFIAGEFISMAMIRGFVTGAVSFYSNPILWIIFLLSLLIPVFTDKSFYCSHLCPFGAAQELAGQMTEKKSRLPRNLLRISRAARPLLFGLLVFLIITDYKVDLSLTEPFAAFLYNVAAPFTIILALASLWLSLFYSKPWCRWFCPTGQFLEYFRSDK